MIDLTLQTLCPLLLYAETHFRFFKGFPSLLRNKDPEILFDCPRRADPGERLPILLIINDLPNLPITIHEVNITVNQSGLPTNLFTFKAGKENEIAHEFTATQKVFRFFIDRESLPDKLIYINCKLTVTIDGHQKIILNDNIQTSSKAPFSCYLSDEYLPGKEYCSLGDLHFHSQYSQSHVEFGPPLIAADSIAKASGLDFIAITDHSYDLACKMSNYLIEDQSLERWHSLQSQIEKSNFSLIFLPGEEISCLNESGEIVHLCGIGISQYIPGSMDGARKRRVFSSKLTINEAVTLIKKQNGIAFAAHPGSKKSPLQSLFLNRGNWSKKDIRSNQIDAVQAFNGSYKEAWERGKELWINALMNGKRLSLVAGNDAHGDFNRYRAIKVPFISIFENFDRFMGFGKTGIYGRNLSRDKLLGAIREGKTFITTGPYLSIVFSPDPFDHAISIDTISDDKKEFFIHAISTVEFGALSKVTLIGYYKGRNEETSLFSKSYGNERFEVCEPVPLETIENLVYIRAEATSRTKDNKKCAAFTSPCYF